MICGLYNFTEEEVERYRAFKPSLLQQLVWLLWPTTISIRRKAVVRASR